MTFFSCRRWPRAGAGYRGGSSNCGACGAAADRPTETVPKHTGILGENMKQLEAAAAWWGRWRLFVLCIAVPRMLSPNFGHRLSTQFSVEVLHASRTNLGMLDSVRHWVGLVSNPLGGYLARTRGIKWLIVLHTVRAISARSSLPQCVEHQQRQTDRSQRRSAWPQSALTWMARVIS